MPQPSCSSPSERGTGALLGAGGTLSWHRPSALLGLVVHLSARVPPADRVAGESQPVIPWQQVFAVLARRPCLRRRPTGFRLLLGREETGITLPRPPIACSRPIAYSTAIAHALRCDCQRTTLRSPTHCAAIANALRCDRQCSALRLPMHYAAIANAARCIDRPAWAERMTRPRVLCRTPVWPGK